jgi:TetR/AcrR family transcriptional regulator, mexJK operon transcriptional repressor
VTRKHLLPEERREQIIDAALEVFAEKGFEGTSNKEVARVAGMASPGLIYHYFTDKLDLLKAAIQSQTLRVGPPAITLDPTRPLNEVLYEVTGHFINDMKKPKVVRIMRVMLGEAIRRPEIAMILSEAIEKVAFSKLETLFQAHIERGTLRADLDPTLTTVRFLGALFYVFFAVEVMKVSAAQNLDMSKMQYQIVDDFLQGVLAPAPSQED